MRFSAPFDLRQRAEAVRFYRRGRSYLNALYSDHAPKSSVERTLRRLLKNHLRQFGEELQKPLGMVDVEGLNDLATGVEQLEMEYAIEQNIRRLQG